MIRKSIGLAVIVCVLTAMAFISGFLVVSMFSQPLVNQTSSSISKPKAAIVDQLSLTRPNQTFIETATNILKKAGYTVDYYPGEEVTVNSYGRLLAYGYNLIIFRVHSSSYQMQGEEIVKSDVTLFTSEIYSNSKHVQQQLNEQVVSVKYLSEEHTLYFGIKPSFITSHGKFDNTTIVMMGCDGLTTTSMAEAFIENGARGYIGWYGSVMGIRNDPAITYLLRKLITEKQTIIKAVGINKVK